jgi:Sec-independent protein translocase protein TatA
MAARHQAARRQVASPILSLLRTRRPFRLVVLVLLVLFLFKNLPRAVVDRFQKDTGLETSGFQKDTGLETSEFQKDTGLETSEDPSKSLQGQQQSSQKLPYKPFRQPAATTSATTLKSPPILGKHLFRADGLVEVNEDGAHPIYELISRAEQEWEKKLKRVSRTLGQASNEYRRRYKRRPPKGFDLW